MAVESRVWISLANSLYEVISHGRAAESWFHDENDPEVDRLFNSSPPLIEQVATYELDSVFGFDGFQQRDKFPAGHIGRPQH